MTKEISIYIAKGMEFAERRLKRGTMIWDIVGESEEFLALVKHRRGRQFSAQISYVLRNRDYVWIVQDQ